MDLPKTTVVQCRGRGWGQGVGRLMPTPFFLPQNYKQTYKMLKIKSYHIAVLHNFPPNNLYASIFLIHVCTSFMNRVMQNNMLMKSAFASKATQTVNPLTPKLFAKNHAFLEILAVFRLDFGQISFNLVENAFATRQLAVLAPSIAI